MDATVIIIIALAVVAAVAFYTGHLRGVATTLKDTHARFVAEAAAHGSLADELKYSRDQLRSLLFSKPAVPAVVSESLTSAAAAVAAVAPAPDPLVAKRAAFDAEIAALTAQRDALK
jgi:hypothetical protein